MKFITLEISGLMRLWVARVECSTMFLMSLSNIDMLRLY